MMLTTFESPWLTRIWFLSFYPKLHMVRTLDTAAGTAAPGRYVLWDVENPRCTRVLQQQGVAPFAEKACFQGRSMTIHHPISERDANNVRCNKRMFLVQNWLARVCASLLVDCIAYIPIEHRLYCDNSPDIALSDSFWNKIKAKQPLFCSTPKTHVL